MRKLVALCVLVLTLTPPWGSVGLAGSGGRNHGFYERRSTADRVNTTYYIHKRIYRRDYDRKRNESSPAGGVHVREPAPDHHDEFMIPFSIVIEASAGAAYVGVHSTSSALERIRITPAVPSRATLTQLAGHRPASAGTLHQ